MGAPRSSAQSLKDEIDVDAVFALAEELQLSGRVHRGLAIVLVLFPELSVIIKSSRLDIPAWEKMALRLAANKILKSRSGGGRVALPVAC